MKKYRGNNANFFTISDAEEKAEVYQSELRPDSTYENAKSQQRQKEIITEERALPAAPTAVIDFADFANTGYHSYLRDSPRFKSKTHDYIKYYQPNPIPYSYYHQHHNPFGLSGYDRTSMTDRGFYQAGSPYDHEKTQDFSKIYSGSASHFQYGSGYDPFSLEGGHGHDGCEIDESSRQTLHINNQERGDYGREFLEKNQRINKNHHDISYENRNYRNFQEKPNLKEKQNVVNQTINDMIKGSGKNDWEKIRRAVKEKVESNDLEHVSRNVKKRKLDTGEAKSIQAEQEIVRSLNDKNCIHGEVSLNAEDQDEHEERNEEDDEKQWMKGINGRSSKGLRIVSLKVKDIVCKKKETTYKDVAEALIEELKLRSEKSDNLTVSDLDISKDEQNVRRRVYDALNVLISAEVLKKKGKIVYSDQRSLLLGNSLKKTIHYEKRRLLEEIQKKKEAIEKRKEELKESILKVLSIRNLFQRNCQLMNQPVPQLTENPDSFSKKITPSTSLNKKKRPGRPRNDEQALQSAGDNWRNESEEGVISNKNKDFQVREKIKFPFLVLPLPKEDNKLDSITLNMNKTKNELRVISYKPLKIYGDLDVLLKLGFYKVSKESWMDWIPEEMHEYVPEELKD